MHGQKYGPTFVKIQQRVSCSEGGGGTRAGAHLAAYRGTDRRCFCAAEDGAVGGNATDGVLRPKSSSELTSRASTLQFRRWRNA